MIAEVKNLDTNRWEKCGRVFASNSDHGPYKEASPELLAELTDGQLLDALALEGRSEAQARADHERYVAQQRSGPFSDLPSHREDRGFKDYHKAFRDLLSPEAQKVMADWNDRKDQAQAQVLAFREEWGKAVEAYDAEHGREWPEPIPDEVSYEVMMEPKVKAVLRARRDSADLTAEVRQSIVDAALNYRPYDDGDLVSISFDLADGDPPHKTDEPYHDRNYNLFGLLANVRNGGYRGEPRSVEPIDDPRGLPEDISPEAQEWMGYHSDHSPSWLTLNEIESALGEPITVTHSGYLTEKDYIAMRDHGTKPSMWSGGISGQGIRTFTAQGYEAWKEQGRRRLPPVSGGSWLDPTANYTPELLAAVDGGEVVTRHVLDDPLRANGRKELELPREAAFGLPNVRGDVTGEVVVEYEHPIEQLLELAAPDLEALKARTERDLATLSAVGSLTTERVLAERDAYNRKLEKILAEADETLGRPDIKPYVYMEWTDDIQLGYFTSYTVPALRALIPEGGTDEEVRIVFGFDS